MYILSKKKKWNEKQILAKRKWSRATCLLIFKIGLVATLLVQLKYDSGSLRLGTCQFIALDKLGIILKIKVEE